MKNKATIAINNINIIRMVGTNTLFSRKKQIIKIDPRRD